MCRCTGSCRWVHFLLLCHLCGTVDIFISFTSVCLEDSQAQCTLIRRPNSCHHFYAYQRLHSSAASASEITTLQASHKLYPPLPTTTTTLSYCLTMSILLLFINHLKSLAFCYVSGQQGCSFRLFRHIITDRVPVMGDHI